MARAEVKLEKAILALVAAEQAEGVLLKDLCSHESLDAQFPAVAVGERLKVANRLLADHRLRVFQRRDGTQLIKLAGVGEAKLKGLNTEELMVYQHIRAAGNTGVWTKDIKMRTNLGQPQINKIIKALEGRSLIKAVKNVNNPAKKLYMLADLEPSIEITGGAWYSGQQLDTEFINVLAETAFKFIRAHEPTLQEITDFVNSRGVTRVHLTAADLERVVGTLIADGSVEDVLLEDESRYRLAVVPVPERSGATLAPCGVCPVIDQCREGGHISPQSCAYYAQWLADM